MTISRMKDGLLNPGHRLYGYLKETPPAWWEKLKSDPELYIDIRKENRIMAYYLGGRVAEISFGRGGLRVTTHPRYLGHSDRSDSRYYHKDSKGRYNPVYQDCGDWLESRLDELKANIRDSYARGEAGERTREKRIQGRLVIRGRDRYLDSEFAHHLHEEDDSVIRIDLVKIVGGKIIFEELKRIVDNRLNTHVGEPEIGMQMRNYSAFLAENRDSLARYYRTLYSIKVMLGLPVPAVQDPAALEVSVVPELIIVQNYDRMSKGRRTRIKEIVDFLSGEGISYKLIDIGDMADTEFKRAEHDRQIELLKTDIFVGAANGGSFTKRIKDEKTGKYVIKKLQNLDIVLRYEDRLLGLFGGIRTTAVNYFREYSITWFNQELDKYAPTGHLLSSQNHCLNHLFPLRNDGPAVLKLINSIQDRVRFVKVLSNPIDSAEKDSFIAFEFVYNNEVLLGETRHGRGSKCTSVDAAVYAEDIDGRRWLIPIEWKYTEMYDKMYPANENSLKRYRNLPDDKSNLNGWNEEIYKHDPCYELARQTLLAERIIREESTFFHVDDYLHIIVIPSGNEELVELVSGEFLPTLKDKGKCIITDPCRFVLPALDEKKYSELRRYLEKRYWKR